MPRLTNVLSTGLLAVLGMAGLCQLAHAQTAAPAVRIAVVNVKQINDVYVKVEVGRDDTQEWARQQQDYLDELRNKYVYLGQDAFDEVVQILRQTRPLPAKSVKRERELRQVNDQNEERFLELQAKLDRTPQEQDEFNRLQASVEEREKQLKTIMVDLQKQLDARQQQVYDRVMSRVQEAITQVAAEGGFQLVLNKLVVVYGGDDITDAVLEKLTGKPAGGAIATPDTPEAETEEGQ